jgi:signal transduction histidine kinase
VRFYAARVRGEDGDLIEFVVDDTGIGLTEEQQARLFRPFAQGDTSISRRYGGTGLGLALVSRFCQLMGGQVTATSVAGEGARFVVRLPVHVVEAESQAGVLQTVVA